MVNLVFPKMKPLFIIVSMVAIIQIPSASCFLFDKKDDKLELFFVEEFFYRTIAYNKEASTCADNSDCNDYKDNNGD